LISDADEAGAAGTGFAHHSRDCVVIGKIRSMPKKKKNGSKAALWEFKLQRIISYHQRK
jgi:hypothetical protein